MDISGTLFILAERDDAEVNAIDSDTRYECPTLTLVAQTFDCMMT